MKLEFNNASSTVQRKDNIVENMHFKLKSSNTYFGISLILIIIFVDWDKCLYLLTHIDVKTYCHWTDIRYHGQISG